MTVKFTTATTKVIREWLKARGINTSARLFPNASAELEYDAENNYIRVPGLYDGCLDDIFIAWLKAHGLKDNFGVIALSILHEVGHAVTCKYFTDEEWLECATIKEILYKKEDATDEEMGNLYWNVPDEYAANMWLIMFANNFPTRVKELSEKIKATVIMGE
jgi:hypothetical protein